MKKYSFLCEEFNMNSINTPFKKIQYISIQMLKHHHRDLYNYIMKKLSRKNNKNDTENNKSKNQNELVISKDGQEIHIIIK